METALDETNPKGEGNNIAKKDVIQILRDKDHYKHSVEISQNAKGEPQVTVKTHSEESIEEAGTKALEEYKRIQKELMK